ncbi:MAG: carboxypeptidase regulatory-like domain-containing protein [Candidatus Heimdallarchaeota archaeon]
MKSKKIIGLTSLILILSVSILGGFAVNILAPPPSSFTGYIKESGTGNPIEGARVELNVYVFGTGWVYIGYQNTASDGSYTFSNVPIGAREVEVSKTGYQTYEGAFQSIIYLTLSGYTYTFYGYVKACAGGSYISGVEVKIACGAVKTYTTGVSGYYSITFTFSTSLARSFLITAKKTDISDFSESVVMNPGSLYKNIYLSAWALIVGAETEERFTRDAFGMYNTLMDHYGFSDERIYLLTTRSTIDSTSVPRDRAATVDNVFWALDQLALNVEPGDQVIIWWTGHGWYNLFTVDGENLWAYELDDELDDITCAEMDIFLGPCHSGSFIDNLDGEQNRAIYTSCKSTQSGWTNGYHSYFPWATYRGLDPGSGYEQEAEAADTNSNGRVSLYELFTFCVNFVSSSIPSGESQDPQRWIGSSLDDSSIYIGDHFY